MKDVHDNKSCTCGLKEHIQKMIDKCEKEMTLIRSSGETELDKIIFQSEERYEYIEGLHSKLTFMLDYPEREQIV